MRGQPFDAGCLRRAGPRATPRAAWSVGTATISRSARGAPSARPAPAGIDGPPEAQAGRLAQPPFEPADRPQLAEQADLAHEDRASGDRRVAERRGERHGERQVKGRLGHAQAAGQAGVDVLAAKVQADPSAEHGDEQGQRGSSRCR